MNREIQGIIAAMVTPMDKTEAVNLSELRRQTERLITAGLHGLFCLGTNGEAYVLEEKEKLEIIRCVVEQANGRLPVLAGTGCVSTTASIALAKEAERLGADALSVISPWFAAASQEELYRHFMTVADSVQIPVFLYNIPARTGINLSVDTVRRLAQAGNIAGIKDSSGNFDQILWLVNRNNSSIE